MDVIVKMKKAHVLAMLLLAILVTACGDKSAKLGRIGEWRLDQGA